MNTEKKLTAVEWLFDEMLKAKFSMKEIIQQAKEKEKQQIIDAVIDTSTFGESLSYVVANEYYEQIFKKE